MFEKKVYSFSFVLFCNDGLNRVNGSDTFAEEISEPLHLH